MSRNARVATPVRLKPYKINTHNNRIGGFDQATCR
jgi:hypothetical protein